MSLNETLSQHILVVDLSEGSDTCAAAGRCALLAVNASKKSNERIRNGALENAPPNWVGLEGSSAPDVRSIVRECGGNTYDALLRWGGGGGGGGCHV